jgi:hypothetical protein
MEKIRILIYTDGFAVNDDPDQNLTSWGLSELKKFIVYKTSGLVEIEFNFVRRHQDKQKLDSKLLCQFDELWIFGVLGPPEPLLQLDDLEMQALKNWMDDGGGIFFTGDHSAPNTVNNCKDDHQTFMAHGASLGRRIKRVKDLHVWDGPPTACANDNFNTQEGPDLGSLDQSGLDDDNVAQTLELSEPPHRLFWWKVKADGEIIPVRKFPDHGHESELLAPEDLNDDWPEGPPFPVVAASGIDKRFPDMTRIYKVVVAYDGDSVSVGRIVMDSSFHHYFNVNIRSIPERDAKGYPQPDSDLDQIAQYYANLALWLIPQTIRDQIKLELPLRLAGHPDVFEVRGTDLPYLGSIARNALELEIGFSNLYRFLAPSEFEDDLAEDARQLNARQLMDELLALIFLRQNNFRTLELAEQEIVLGGVIRAYHEYFLSNGAYDPSWLTQKPLPSDMLKRGFDLVREEKPELMEKLSL